MTKEIIESDAGWTDKSLQAVWNNLVLGESKFSPQKDCQRLAKEYADTKRSPEQCAKNFINWQTGKSGITGFALGLPGLAAMPVTIPGDFVSVSYFQLRMIAVIGILFGWDPKSDQLRTIAFACLLGTAGQEASRNIAVAASSRLGNRFVKGISGESLKSINRFLRVPNLFIKGTSAASKAGGKAAATVSAKAGAKGIINLSKMVPLLGGVVGGGINAVVTRKMGHLAIRLLRDGPPDGGSVAAI